MLRTFLKYWQKKKNFYTYKKCIREFKALYDKDLNIERVEAVTCVPLNDGQIERLKAKLEKIISKKVLINNTIDSDIMGGVILKLNDSQYDGSIRSRLERLCDSLKWN